MQTSSFNLQVEKITELLEKVTTEEVNKNWTEEALREKVQERMDEYFDKIMGHILGFRQDTWSKIKAFEVAGNSIVGEAVHNLVRQTLENYIQVAVTNGKFVLDEKHIAAMEKEFDATIHGHVGRQLISMYAKNKLAKLLSVLDGNIEGAS